MKGLKRIGAHGIGFVFHLAFYTPHYQRQNTTGKPALFSFKMLSKASQAAAATFPFIFGCLFRKILKH
jgi:hypothetical protein